MFGYVRPVPAELLVREYELYRAFYCGVCRQMKKHTGILSTATLSYDAVFFALVRTVLEEGEVNAVPCRCIVHPVKCRQCVQGNEALSYTARAFAVLAYGKAKDARADAPALLRLPLSIAEGVMRRAANRAALPDLLAAMEGELAGLAALEKENCPTPDAVFDCSGRMLGAFFAYGLPKEKADAAYAIGFSLGRFIAALDACDDFEKDSRRHRYNPYRFAGSGKWDEEEKRIAFLSMQEELCRLEEAMQKLKKTYRDATDILENTLYLGLPAAMQRVKEGKPLPKRKETWK